MQRHLEEIARRVARGAQAVLLMDRAGWHTTANLVWPKNITPILPPFRAPEINPVENIWRYLRENGFSNRAFRDYDDIVDAACDAWNKLIAIPKKSHQSECATGRIAVNSDDRWYKALSQDLRLRVIAFVQAGGHFY